MLQNAEVHTYPPIPHLESSRPQPGNEDLAGRPALLLMIERSAYKGTHWQDRPAEVACSLDLCADYGARIRLLYVEAPAERLFAQNREREHPVPAAAIERLPDRWDVPDLTEAHRVDYSVMEAPNESLSNEMAPSSRALGGVRE
jgi:hypothetical protein